MKERAKMKKEGKKEKVKQGEAEERLQRGMQRSTNRKEAVLMGTPVLSFFCFSLVGSFSFPFFVFVLPWPSFRGRLV